MRRLRLFLLTILFACFAGNEARADLIISFAESTPGSATIEEGVGGTAVIGVFASLSDLGDMSFDSFDSFDLYIDIGGDGNGLPDAGFSFSTPDVIAGDVFSNAAKNAASDVTVLVANADIQVSADRAPFTFTSTPTKLFDLLVDIAPSVGVGDYSVAARDDSGGLMAFNLAGNNLLSSNPSAFTFNPGSISVSAVPEPSSVGLLLFTVTAFLRRRSRS